MDHRAQLDPDIAAMLAQAVPHPPYAELGPEAARANFREEALAQRAPGEPLEAVAEVRDTVVPGPGGPIPVRVLRPEDGEPLPIVVYFHGGGWTMGDLDTHEPQARMLANQTRAVVVAVHYRLAPEHPYPAALQDAVAAVQWAAQHGAEVGGDPGRLAVAGDSSGGNLAAAVALWARDHDGPPLAAQCLVYPVVDVRDHAQESWNTYGEGYVLDGEDMVWFNANYVPDPSKREQPYVSPLLAHDLTGLPPAVIAVAACDILHDQGEAYADRLEAAGVPVWRSCQPSLGHSFFRHGRISPTARKASEQLCAALRKLLHAS